MLRNCLLAGHWQPPYFQNFLMKKTWFLFLSIPLLQRCSNSDQARQTPPQADKNAPQIMRGSFKIQADAYLLHDCGTGKIHTVKPAPLLDSLYRTACLSIVYPEKSVYAVLRGTLADEVMTVTDIDAVEAKNPWNTCIPFEFWCSGTEPFWDLEISEAEGGLFYQDIGRAQGAKYAWTAPKINANTWIYDVPANQGQPAFRVVIKKENANNGMSEVTYNYSSEITVNGEKRQGVAIRWGEPKLEPK